jgi:hypothetical protein
MQEMIDTTGFINEGATARQYQVGRVFVNELGDDAPAPTGLAAVAVSSTRIDLTWDQYNAEALVDEFITLEYGTAADFTGATAVDGISLDATGTSVTGLTANTLYYFRIKSNPDVEADSDWSNTASATTLAASTGNNQTNRMSIGISIGM